MLSAQQQAPLSAAESIEQEMLKISTVIPPRAINDCVNSNEKVVLPETIELPTPAYKVQTTLSGEDEEEAARLLPIPQIPLPAMNENAGEPGSLLPVANPNQQDMGAEATDSANSEEMEIRELQLNDIKIIPPPPAKENN